MRLHQRCDPALFADGGEPDPGQGRGARAGYGSSRAQREEAKSWRRQTSPPNGTATTKPRNDEGEAERQTVLPLKGYGTFSNCLQVQGSGLP